jgi:hypothetical protein
MSQQGRFTWTQINRCRDRHPETQLDASHRPHIFWQSSHPKHTHTQTHTPGDRQTHTFSTLISQEGTVWSGLPSCPSRGTCGGKNGGLGPPQA